MSLPYDVIIERYTAWAQTRPDIRAAAIVGSRARTDRPADQWSDMDLITITSDPQHYLANTDWLEAIGTVWMTFLERQGTGEGMERRVLFEGGVDVDFVFFSYESAQHIAIVGWPPDIGSVVRRGFRVVLDKDGLAAKLSQLEIPTPPEHRLSSDEFLNLCKDVLYHAVWGVKKLRRGEIWMAQSNTNNYIIWRLLQMIEWHAKATHGWDYDTWHNGRFLEKWADPRIVAQLRGTTADYNEVDIQRAMLARLDLFRWVAQETAERLGYVYPIEADRHVMDWIQKTLLEHTVRSQ
jgi:aminoglycoside 6-adenylyltransferase